MTFVVDANILFSALITPEGKISDIITHPTSSFRMVSCHYAFIELFKHQPKILKYSKQTDDNLFNALDSFYVFRGFNFSTCAGVRGGGRRGSRGR